MSPERKQIRLCADSVSIPTRRPFFSKWNRKQLKMRKFDLRRRVNITESLPMDRAMDLKPTISIVPPPADAIPVQQNDAVVLTDVDRVPKNRNQRTEFMSFYFKKLKIIDLTTSHLAFAMSPGFLFISIFRSACQTQCLCFNCLYKTRTFVFYRSERTWWTTKVCSWWRHRQDCFGGLTVLKCEINTSEFYS